jgi:hypothetical protein
MQYNRNIEQENKLCSICNETKAIELFIKNKNRCKDCNNEIRRTQFKENEELRNKIHQQKSASKRKKTLQRQEMVRQRQLEIGKNKFQTQSSKM